MHPRRALSGRARYFRSSNRTKVSLTRRAGSAFVVPQLVKEHLDLRLARHHWIVARRAGGKRGGRHARHCLPEGRLVHAEALQRRHLEVARHLVQCAREAARRVVVCLGGGA
eukprot:scaffold18932_cov65-Phaeocystis_antarctica.AAC.3